MASGRDEIPIVSEAIPFISSGPEVDEDIQDQEWSDETESVFDGQSNVSLTTLATSINHYRLENNRKYHTFRDGSYWIPHDEAALKLDNYAHLLFLLTLNDKLFLAPLHQPRRIIDLGTGIGIWAQNIADQFPEAEVIGNDLSNVQQDYTAANLRFDVDDCCSEWVHPLDYFDYVHIRLLYASVADWPALYQQCYDHLAPGGYIEHSELDPTPRADDGTISPGDPLDAVGKLAIDCSKKTGKPMVIRPHLKEWITAAGFVDVVEHVYKWPLGDWPADARLKEIGTLRARHFFEGIEAWSMRILTLYYGYSETRVQQFCQELKAAISSRKHHVYHLVSVVYARKPLQ